MSKATNIKNGNVNIKCEYCGGCGYHKMSCPTQKATVFIPTLEEDRMYPIPMTAHSAYIPTLEGDEAEDFIRKVESAERATIDWSRQMNQMELALNKSRIANRKLKYAKGEAPKVKRSKDVEE